jgi:iron complex transport system substrate-binding protein
VLGAALAGCGASTTKSGTTASPGSAVTVHAANGAVTIPHRPARIVSLSPTATEMLYAIGAGKQVKAVDSLSDYPPGAPVTKLSAYQPNAEAIIAYNPDLVVISDDVGGVAEALEKVKIPVLLEPAATTLNGAYRQFDQLGEATGHEDQARSYTAGMQRQITTAVAGAPKKTGLTYYYELSNDLYTVTSATFVGRIFTMFGLHDVADGAGVNRDGGYPQLSAESLLTDDPKMIFLADTVCCGQSATTVAKRPGWKSVAAVKDGDVVPLNDDIASRWGPRLVILVQDIAAALRKATTG